VHRHGAKKIYVGASHAVFVGQAIALLKAAPIDEIVVTNSVPLGDKAQSLPNLRVVSIAPLLGEAIKRIHRNESVSYLFE